jgi:hypothetical protein
MLTFSDCQSFEGFLVMKVDVSIALDGLFKTYTTFATAAKKEPIRKVNFVSVLFWDI